MKPKESTNKMDIIIANAAVSFFFEQFYFGQ